MESIVTVFTFMATDGWTDIFNSAFRMPGIQPTISFFYFYSLYIFGKNILFNLFLAILLREFDQRSIQQEE